MDHIVVYDWKYVLLAISFCSSYAFLATATMRRRTRDCRLYCLWVNENCIIKVIHRIYCSLRKISILNGAANYVACEIGVRITDLAQRIKELHTKHWAQELHSKYTCILFHRMRITIILLIHLMTTYLSFFLFPFSTGFAVLTYFGTLLLGIDEQ
jgi:hypothetical protein